MILKPGPYTNSFVRRPADTAESRDLRSICNKLEKELERTHSRNDLLSKELSSLRESHANQQVLISLVHFIFDEISFSC
jgi:hypothetical protein